MSFQSLIGYSCLLGNRYVLLGWRTSTFSIPKSSAPTNQVPLIANEEESPASHTCVFSDALILVPQSDSQVIKMIILINNGWSVGEGNDTSLIREYHLHYLQWSLISVPPQPILIPGCHIPALYNAPSHVFSDTKYLLISPDDALSFPWLMMGSSRSLAVTLRLPFSISGHCVKALSLHLLCWCVKSTLLWLSLGTINTQLILEFFLNDQRLFKKKWRMVGDWSVSIWCLYS